MTTSKVEAAGSALFGLLFIQSRVVRPIDDALERAHQTNLTGFELLLRLGDLPDGASVRYLSDQVVISPSRVSRVAEDLVRRGLLERAASVHDGRLSLVRLTEAGRDRAGGDSSHRPRECPRRPDVARRGRSPASPPPGPRRAGAGGRA